MTNKEECMVLIATINAEVAELNSPFFGVNVPREALAKARSKANFHCTNADAVCGSCAIMASWSNESVALLRSITKNIEALVRDLPRYH